ncbi:MAG: LTA synthase family protein [Clostridia bacterium]|nr:LTA synthase family protein [Clostridia bacterium]
MAFTIFPRKGEADKKHWIRFGIRTGLLLALTAAVLILHLLLEEPWSRWWIDGILLLLIWGAGFTRFQIPEGFGWGLLALTPAAHYLLVELLQPHSRDIFPNMHWLNFGFYYLAFLFLFLTCYRKSAIAVCIGTVLCSLCGIANTAGWQFRSLPILPWDLNSASTAFSVLKSYSFTFTHLFWTVLLGMVCLAVLGFRMPVRSYAKPAVHFSVSAVGAAALIGFLFFLQTDAVFTRFGGYRYLFTPGVYYERNGTAVGFLSTLHYLNVSKPEGYDAASLQEMADQMDPPADQKDDLPNVIVIMNEAFSDLSVLGSFETNMGYLDFWNSLTENTVRGNLYVSVKGGNTANTEYEFLTGDTMAFLPAGSIPYQQYIKGEMPSLVTWFSNLGYSTLAIHPYQASGWSRDKAYPFLGFETSLFYNDMRPVYASNLLRNYYSDASLFRYIRTKYEEKEAGKPLFLFTVTMQNHGSYDQEYDNFSPQVTVTGTSGTGARRLSSYLSLIRETDLAFESLVSYFAGQEEKTVIVMFGDHQPNDNVVRDILRLNGMKATEEELDGANRYITPFVIWANYDIGEQYYEGVSVNYLSGILCEAAGIPLTKYQQLLRDVQETYPVLTAHTVSADGTLYFSDKLNELSKAADSPLKLLQSVQYNHLVDRNNRIQAFFD